MTLSIIYKVINRAYWLRNELTKNPLLDNSDFANHFAAYNQKITEVTGKPIPPLFDIRCQEIFRAVQKYDMKTVLEMGTGRTTFLFN